MESGHLAISPKGIIRIDPMVIKLPLPATNGARSGCGRILRQRWAKRAAGASELTPTPCASPLRQPKDGAAPKEGTAPETNGARAVRPPEGITFVSSRILTNNYTEVVAKRHKRGYPLRERYSALPGRVPVKMNLMRAIAIAGLLGASVAAHASPLLYLLGVFKGILY